MTTHQRCPNHSLQGRLWRSWLWLLCLAWIMPAQAGEPLLLGKDFPYQVIADPAGTLQPEQAIQQLRNSTEWQQEGFARGYTRITYWLQFRLPANAFNAGNRWLETGPNFIDDIRLYLKPANEEANWQLLQAGDFHPKLNTNTDIQRLDYRGAVFSLPPPNPQQDYEVLVRLQTSSTMMYFVRLWQPEDFLRYSGNAIAFWSFYLGIALLSALLAIVLAVLLKTPLLWAASAFSSAYLLVASVQGFWIWLFPQALAWQHYSTSIFTMTTYAALMWLSSEILLLRQQLPRIHKIILGCSVITLLLLPLIFMDHYRTAVFIKTGLFLSATCLFFIALIRLLFTRPAPLKTFGASLLPTVCILGSLFSLLSVFGLIPFRSEIYVVWQYLIIANMLLVLVIAVYRIREKHLEQLEKQQLAHELQTEREASFHQRQFMGMVSHEFRTPLAIIAGTLENLCSLEEQPDSPRGSRYQKIQRATERLNQLTDNCLADARLAAGNLYLDEQPANLTDIIFSALTLLQVSQKHPFIFLLDHQEITGSPPPFYVQADAALLRIAISNILDNAVKYSASGRITTQLDTVQLQLTICDEGPGIPNELAGDIIFERYRRGNSKRPGAGLGLFVTRQIIEAHGGTIRCYNHPAKGACFVIRIPKTRCLSGDDHDS